MNRFKELDCVTLRTARAGLPAGALGTVLLADLPGRYLVEFADDDGRTIDELDLPEADLAPYEPAATAPAP